MTLKTVSEIGSEKQKIARMFWWPAVGAKGRAGDQQHPLLNTHACARTRTRILIHSHTPRPSLRTQVQARSPARSKLSLSVENMEPRYPGRGVGGKGNNANHADLPGKEQGKGARDW